MPLLLLGACSDSADSDVNPYATQSDSESINDPFLSSQWYLRNNGQTGLDDTRNTGVVGADINAFASSAMTGANYAHTMKGIGVEIAIVDTGLELAHQDLTANVIKDGSYNFLYPNNGKAQNDPTSLETSGDHGTSVAGLAAARGGNDLGIWGVAPQASLRGFNFILSDQTLNMELASLGYQPSVSGFSGMSNATVAIFNKSYGSNPTHVYDPATTEGLNVTQKLDAMQYGAETLRDAKGALYLKAAGNEFAGGSVFTEQWCAQAIARDLTCFNANQEPEHNTPYQIVVGAFDADDTRAAYSNTGSSLWISAPGGYSIGLVTTDQSGCDKGYSKDNSAYAAGVFDLGGNGTGNEQCHYYSSFTGTSAATPVASGVVALILEANPSLTWRDVKHILAVTARQLDANMDSQTMLLNLQRITLEDGWVENAAGYPFSNAYGFGAVNVLDAVAMAQDWQTTDTHLNALMTQPQTEQTFATDKLIPSASATGLTKTQTVSDALVVETVVVNLDITATAQSGSLPALDPSDYLIRLTSPSGTESILLTPFNAYQSGNNMVGLQLASHAFYGESSAGEWHLTIVDVDSNTNNRINHAGEGQLDRFQLTFYGH